MCITVELKLLNKSLAAVQTNTSAGGVGPASLLSPFVTVWSIVKT